MSIGVELHADCHACGDCNATEALCSTCAADFDREHDQWWASKARVAMQASLDVLRTLRTADTNTFAIVNAAKVGRAIRLLRDRLTED
jgi:hypothetical protein